MFSYRIRNDENSAYQPIMMEEFQAAINMAWNHLAQIDKDRYNCSYIDEIEKPDFEEISNFMRTADGDIEYDHQTKLGKYGVEHTDDTPFYFYYYPNYCYYPMRVR